MTINAIKKGLGKRRGKYRPPLPSALLSTGAEPLQASSLLVQEAAGMQVSISSDLPEAALHACTTFADTYDRWLHQDRFNAWGRYKQQYFVVAVGGGNTMKAQYLAMIKHLHSSVDWLERVRFYFIEDSTGEARWESPEDSLIINFIAPLSRKLSKTLGRRRLLKQLELDTSATDQDIVDAMCDRMIHPIDLSPARSALAAGQATRARRLANAEALRYQQDIQRKLGASMEFHYLISGIGKKGTLGAFSPYMPELRIREPGCVVLKTEESALRVALNRGVLINSECLSLIVSGSLKLRALGRFEMEESADFEQTVMETPLRMLRETPEIAERVHIFADEQALHFDVTEFKYREGNSRYSAKAETREGEEANGVHTLLLHGFMGLFSFTSFLVRLPSAWTVSALHRGSHAKTLANSEIFPHYANAVRQATLDLWRTGQVVPIAGHSIAGIIIDHLLLSILDDYDAPIPAYEDLQGDDRGLVDALRAGGLVALATWAPSDAPHTGKNIRNLVAHLRQKKPLDYQGLEQIYESLSDEAFITEEAYVNLEDSLRRLDRFLETPVAEPIINGANYLIRTLLNKKSVQQGMLNVNSPYVLRLVGNRLLKTASFYGMSKEVNAALHDPAVYQQRHVKALQMIAAYDIPYLSIIHEDDFLVSARRHREEYDYLIKLRKEKAGVSRISELKTTTRFVKLGRDADELPVDPLNPHLLIMSTSSEGNRLAREITGEITRFVNENIDRSASAGRLKRLPSVRKWIKERGPARKRGKTKVA